MIKYSGVSTLEVLEGAESYNRWITSKITPHLKSPILEVGAGSGNISKYLLNSKSITLTDQDTGLVNLLRKKYRLSAAKALVVDIEKNLPRTMVGKYNSVFAVNVLEHIQDDDSALKNMHKALRIKGKVILLVPANKFAYTRLDKQLGHFRRYSKKDLVEKVEDAGFKLESVNFFNMLGLLTWILRDRIEKENIFLKPYQIAIFDRIVPILRFIESIIPVPIGISLIVVARKIRA